MLEIELDDEYGKGEEDRIAFGRHTSSSDYHRCIVIYDDEASSKLGRRCRPRRKAKNDTTISGVCKSIQ